MSPPNPYEGQGPVHPGPEPMFPQAEAAAAISAIQTVLDQFMALYNTRDGALGTIWPASSGQSINAFVSRNNELSAQLSSSWSSRGSPLQLDAEWLRTAIADATTLHSQWQTQLDYHLQWTAANPGVDPRTNAPI